MNNSFSPKFYRLLKTLPVLSLLNSFFAAGQEIDSAINIYTITRFEFINNVEMSFAPRSLDVEKNYGSVSFSEGLINNGRVKPSHVSDKILLRFNIYNDRDSAADCYFFPGFFFDDARLYHIQNHTPVPVRAITPDHKDNISFRKIVVLAGDTMTLVAELSQVKTYNNRVRPRLINSIYLPAYISELHNTNQAEALFTYIF